MIQIFFNIYKAVDKMIEHDGVEHAGYMAFMMLMSIFPFFVFILAFTSFFGASELGELFLELSVQNLPAHSVESIKDHIEELLVAPPQGLLTLAILGTLWTSSSFVECLRTILNRVYEVKRAPNYILRRMLSIFQFLVISSAITLAMLLFVIIPNIIFHIQTLHDLIDSYKDSIDIVRYCLVFISLFFTVSSLYYFIPNIKLKYKEVIPGTFLVIIAWSVSGIFFSKYIIYYNQLSIIYGSLGSIIITLIFFYILNMIFIIGAEFNHLFSRIRGRYA